jgi:hypothetical protein
VTPNNVLELVTQTQENVFLVIPKNVKELVILTQENVFQTPLVIPHVLILKTATQIRNVFVLLTDVVLLVGLVMIPLENVLQNNPLVIPKNVKELVILTLENVFQTPLVILHVLILKIATQI